MRWCMPQTQFAFTCKLQELLATIAITMVSTRSSMRNSKPLDSASVVPPMFLSNFYFNRKKISVYFCLFAATRDLLIVIHLYLCLRLTALIWSLPHFQVCCNYVLSSRIVFLLFFPQSPCEQYMECRNEPLAPLFLQIMVTRAWEDLLFISNRSFSSLSFWDLCPVRFAFIINFSFFLR